MTEITLVWPFDNVLHETPLSTERVEDVLRKLSEVGVAAAHSAERIELLDIISGTSTGYVHCAERFSVAEVHERVARELILSVLG